MGQRCATAMRQDRHKGLRRPGRHTNSSTGRLSEPSLPTTPEHCYKCAQNGFAPGREVALSPRARFRPSCTGWAQGPAYRSIRRVLDSAGRDESRPVIASDLARWVHP